MNHLKKFFEVDLRSLALFRVTMGLIIILDILYRSAWVKAHYTDWGIIPRKILIDGGLSQYRFSFHLFNGRVEFQIFMLAVAFLFGLSFMLGYRTKLSGFISWVLLLSLQNRAMALINSGDVIMKMMLFWSLFLPLSKVYSIDAALKQKKDEILDYSYFSLPNVFFLLQLCLMYWFSVVTKQTPDWMETQLAVYYALHVDQFAKPLGIWARQFIGLTKAFTWYTLFLEIVGPLFALAPFKWGWLRFLAAALMINLHMGLFMTLEIGFFPWVCISAWLAFFPSCFWELLEKIYKNKLAANFTVYMDQDCGFCRKLVNIIKIFFIVPSIKLAFAQDNDETEKLMRENNSWIIKTQDSTHLFHFEAFIYLMSHSPIFFWLAPLLKLPPFFQIGTFGYKFVANNRMGFSFLTRNLKEASEFKRPSKFTNISLTLIFCYIILYIFHTLEVGFEMPRSLRGVGKTFSFTQKWTMFASPRKKDGWYIFKGELFNGQEVNLWTEEIGKVSYEKPEDVAATYINQRWRKYLTKLNKKKKKKQRKYFSKYLCRRWNQKHEKDERLRKLKIYFFMERTKPPGMEFKIRKRKLWTHYCYGKKKKK